jgi:hypothetical protein
MDVDGWLVNPAVVGGAMGMRGFVEAAMCVFLPLLSLSAHDIDERRWG